jgi:two-component system OmpR family response regulator
VRVLLAEDDAVLADGIAQALKHSGYVVDHASNGAEAEHLLSAYAYDTAILDLGLPEMDGLEVLRQARNKQNAVPILILTARDTLEDRISGLDLGADDYLTKPFKLKELEARIRALIRRKRFSTETKLKLGALRFDTNGRRAYLHDQVLELSAREMDVLELLLSHSGKVVSKGRFIDHLCGWREEVTENAIEVYISRLRRKLEESGLSIKAIRGIGYILELNHVK